MPTHCQVPCMRPCKVSPSTLWTGLRAGTRLLLPLRRPWRTPPCWHILLPQPPSPSPRTPRTTLSVPSTSSGRAGPGSHLPSSAVSCVPTSGSTALSTGSCLVSTSPSDTSLPEGRHFIGFVNHKPLTFAMVAEPWSARQQSHLSYISEFTTDLQHVAGKDRQPGGGLPVTGCGRSSPSWLGLQPHCSGPDHRPRCATPEDLDCRAGNRGCGF